MENKQIVNLKSLIDSLRKDATKYHELRPMLVSICLLKKLAADSNDREIWIDELFNEIDQIADVIGVQ